jgi:hemerythrin-like domain-containing protein
MTRTVLHLVDGLLKALRDHEKKEHALMPKLAARLPELEAALREIELQHRVLENFVADFRRLIGGAETGKNREIVRKVLELMVLLRSHMREEEQRLFEPARRARILVPQEAS